MEHVQVCWNIVFIRVASRLTEFTEEIVVKGVRDYMNCKFTIKFEPLRTFPPMSKMDMRKHMPAISATAITGRVII